MVESSTLKKLTEIVKFRKNSKIEPIPTDEIQYNELNPRKRFGQEEEDELIESIKTKGVLQPVIVYEKYDKSTDKKYVLLDGQRRVQACRKIGVKDIPAHILEKPPSELENLSIMFHIHSAHEDWTDTAIIISFQKILKELKITIGKETKDDILKIKRITSLSEYKIKKYLGILDFPKNIIDKFMESEKKEKPDLDIDTLVELKRPINQMEKILPYIFSEYSREDIVNSIIQKKKDGVIGTNKEIRKLSKILVGVKGGKINSRVASEKLTNFFENTEVSIDEIYSDTAEALEQSRLILKSSEKLKREIENIDLRKISKSELSILREELERLVESIKRRMSRDV